jgi:hypothetical protein
MCIPQRPGESLCQASTKAVGLQNHRWCYSMLGGVTNGSLQVGCRLVDFSSFCPPLRQSIKHILGLSARPKVCHHPPSFPHYEATEVVQLDALTCPVVYKSPHFCVTGWGSIMLSLAKLACAFDLPSHCSSLVTNEILLDSLFHSSC